MREATLQEKIWMAGFMDGEAWIGMVCEKKRCYYRARVAIAQREAKGLDRFTDIYGGRLHLNPRKPDINGEAYYWFCPVSQLGRLLFDVLPFLQIKKRQAELLIEFLSLGPARRGRYGISDELREKRASIHSKLRVLNARGPEGVRLRLIS